MRTAIRSLIVLLVFTLISTLGGALIGWAIGRFAPSYYRGLFPRAFEDHSLDAAEFGIGAGIAQGATMGMIIGAILITVGLIVEGFRQRRASSETDAK